MHLKILAPLSLTLALATLPVLPAVAGDDKKSAHDACCAPATNDDASAHHTLWGRVESVLPARHALLVKHEEIPGVMPAMTMMFLVDDQALKQVSPGDAIKGTMSQTPEGKWKLEDIVVAPR